MYTYMAGDGDQQIYQEIIDDHSKVHVSTSTGNYLDPKLVKTGYKNQITVENAVTGQKKIYTAYVVDGVSYLPDGRRVVPGGNENQPGLVPGGKEAITHLQRVIGEQATYIRYVPIEEKPIYKEEYKTVQVGTELIYPDPPSIPNYESFTLPQPTFTSDLRRESRFIYSMGIDNLTIKNAYVKESGVRITEPMSTEGATQVSIQVAQYQPEEGGIEYYVLSNGKEVPILPEGKTIVENEKLFPNLATRFEMVGSPIEIRKNGQVIEGISLEQARNARDGIYSVTYETRNATVVDIESDKIQFKIIVRLYKSDAAVPYVQSIKANLHGGGSALWQDL